VALEPGTVYDALQRHLKAAGLPKIRFHDLRHTTASMLLSSGIPVLEVSRYLGHSNVATTLNIYAHVTEENRRGTSDRMAQLLGPVSETG
jgi:integrase